MRKTRMSRREFLKVGAAGAGVAALGSMPQHVFGAAPTIKKGTKLAILQATYFIGAAQDLYKQQAAEWGKTNGVEVSTDFLNWPDLQPKIGAAVVAGGVDIVELMPSWNFLYRDSLVDLTKEAQEFGKRSGGFEKFVLNSAPVDGRFLGIPHGQANTGVGYRISMFKQAGVANAEDGTKIDMTWDQFFEVAKKCKAAGHPFGQALGHSTGDPPNFCYAYMWAHGAMEVSKDRKRIEFNKPEFVEGMQKFVQAWKDGYDETGTSWDDSNNNRAFLSEQLACTINGSSIYFAAKKDKPDLARDMDHMLYPRGPAGRFYWLGTRTFGILKSSKNIAAAKEFLSWWFQEKQYGDWWRLQQGYQVPPTVKYSKDPMWEQDPKMTTYRELPKYGRDLGYAGPPDQKASLAWSKYIVVDTFAKAVQSGDAKGAIEWGAEQLKRTYEV